MHCVAWTQVSLPSTTSSEALIHSGEEPSEDDTLFLPRFLPQEIIFAYSPHEGVFGIQPRLQVNLLCSSDWLCLRGIAETECAILPIRELAAYPRCSACERPISGERPSARRSLLAPVLIDEFSWQPDRVPWSGETANTGIYSSRRRATHHPSLAHLATVLALCRGRSLLTRSVSAQEPAAAVLQCRRQPNPGKWTLRNGAGAGSPLIQAALWAHSMTERDIIVEALAEFLDPTETTPARWPGRQFPNTSFRQRRR